MSTFYTNQDVCICKRTSVQNNVVDHAARVIGVVEAERAAQVFRDLLRRVVIVVTCLCVH